MTETPLSLAEPTEERVLHDARAVADASAADQIPADPARVVAVLRTRPAAHSGSASVAGVFLNAETGRLVDSSGAPADLAGHPQILRYEGSYDVLEVLSGPADALPGRYAWTEPLAEDERGVTPAAIFDPFARPAVVMCRYDPAAAGAPFDWVRLLPVGWQVHAAAAAPAAAQPDAATARSWLSAPNDLLFARGARALAGSGQLDPQLAALARAQAHGYRRAVLHFVLLASAQRPAAVSALDADLAPGSDPDHRRAAAIGLLAARLFTPAPAAAALAGWSPLASPGRLRDPDMIAGDAYVREAFVLLAPDGAA
jgi:hypothetical protein